MPTKITVLTSPFSVSVSTNSTCLAEQLNEIYPLDIIPNTESLNSFVDFAVTFNKRKFSFSDSYAFKLGHQHFRYAPKDSMLPVFEWGFNWLVTTFICQHLCIHAAVLEKNGKTIVLPAPPGSGKSTMCALLMMNGWRLLSDEHCLLDLDTLENIPFVRPISLKNKSIEVLKTEYPTAHYSRVYPNTFKGRMLYLAPSSVSWENATKPAKATFIIFPRYSIENKILVQGIKHCDLLQRLVVNSFNYSVLGERGFDALSSWMSQLQAFDLTYSSNDSMLNWVETL